MQDSTTPHRARSPPARGSSSLALASLHEVQLRQDELDGVVEELEATKRDDLLARSGGLGEFFIRGLELEGAAHRHHLDGIRPDFSLFALEIADFGNDAGHLERGKRHTDHGNLLKRNTKQPMPPEHPAAWAASLNLACANGLSRGSRRVMQPEDTTKTQSPLQVHRQCV